MLARIVDLALNLYALGLVVYAICGWIKHPRAQVIIRWLSKWYDPLLQPLHKVIKPVRLGRIAVDFSPMVLLLGIVIVRKGIVALLLLPY